MYINPHPVESAGAWASVNSIPISKKEKLQLRLKSITIICLASYSLNRTVEHCASPHATISRPEEQEAARYIWSKT